MIGIIGGLATEPVVAQQSSSESSPIRSRGDSVSVHLVDTDVRVAVQALASYLDYPVVFGRIPPTRVTIETPHPVVRADLPRLIRGLAEAQGLAFTLDSTAGYYTLEPQQPPGPIASPGAATVASAPDSDRMVQLFVIHLRHAKAADVAATVNALYGRASAVGEPGAPPLSTLSQQLQANQVPPMSSAAPVSGPQPSGAVAGTGAATFIGDVTIVPDPRSNSLLIRASPHDYALIEAAVKELDTRPLQVLIDVIIAEVQRNWTLGFGVDASAPPGRVHGSKTTVSGSQTGAGLTDFVLQVMHLGSLNLDATLTAAEENGDVRILSRPVVIAANNEQATINVGSQRPFVQVARALPNDQATQDQVVQYMDVGTKLTVRPTISPDGYVVLEVVQEVNNATAEIAFNAPVISTRSVETKLLIKDGQTVALGGLTDRERDVTTGGVPLLSSIPLIGGLFGHSSHSTTETELFLFLTPHVIRSDEDADSLTTPLLKHIEKNKP